MVQDEKMNKRLDVYVLRGAGSGISNHYLVITKIRCLKRSTGGVVNMDERYEINISGLVTCKT